jgi:hypothetical protein
MARARVRIAGSSLGHSSKRSNPLNSNLRGKTNGNPGSASSLPEALFDFYIDSEGAVLIAQTYN